MIESEYIVHCGQFNNIAGEEREDDINEDIDESEDYINQWRLLDKKFMKLTQETFEGVLESVSTKLFAKLHLWQYKL